MRTNNILTLNNQDLTNLKSKYVNSVGYKQSPPTRIVTLVSDRSAYIGQPIVGLSFPLKISNGSLKVSQNEDRIIEQILEVLQTSIGERVYRQFFGMPDLIFESISESILEARIENQLINAIKADAIEFKVKVKSVSQEEVAVFVTYQLGSRAPQTIKYLVQ